MNLVGFISTAVLSLTLVAAAPMYAQEQQDEQKAKPEEKKAQPEKSAKQEQKPAAQQEKNAKQGEKSAQQQDKNTKQEEKSAQQQQRTPQAKPEQQAQRASGNRGGRIPDDRFKSNFGREHTFHVSEGDYRNHRFQYGGYWFVFSDPWPSNWLYTQDVYVIEIDGVYYLCNAMYPGINIALSFTP
jgi:flagellar motor protein MotB